MGSKKRPIWQLSCLFDSQHHGQYPHLLLLRCCCCWFPRPKLIYQRLHRLIWTVTIINFPQVKLQLNGHIGLLLIYSCFPRLHICIWLYNLQWRAARLHDLTSLFINSPHSHLSDVHQASDETCSYKIHCNFGSLWNVWFSSSPEVHCSVGGSFASGLFTKVSHFSYYFEWSSCCLCCLH